jgi:phosphatidylserine decarboxylase
MATSDVVRDGIPFVAVPLVLAIPPLALGYGLLALVLVAVAAFMAFFFRDPRRVPPEEPGIIVAPADGRITLIKRSGNEDSSLLISIFLSPFDVHINRSPIAGKITGISYAKGKFLSATSDRASLLNEQNTLTIEGDGLTVYCKQIAGVLARRIVCWKDRGDVVGIGEPFGMIKFGSRTDLTVTVPVELLVKEGMRVRAGETPIARLLR